MVSFQLVYHRLINENVPVNNAFPDVCTTLLFHRNKHVSLATKAKHYMTCFIYRSLINCLLSNFIFFHYQDYRLCFLSIGHY